MLGEYLTYLFLLLADGARYGPLKTQLGNNFLMGKNEYPSDVLSAKRPTTDFVPSSGVVKHKRQESGLSDVAVLETRREGMWSSTCYCCGKRHPGGYTKFPNVTKAVQEQTIKAVEAGHFQRKQDNDSTISTEATASTSRKSAPKKGTNFAMVKDW